MNENQKGAIEELANVLFEAMAEGFPAPSALARRKARHLLLALSDIWTGRWHVYPTPDGEVALDAADGQGSSVVLLCGSDGGVGCFANLNGKFRRKRYSNAEKMSDGFIQTAFEELAG